MNTPRYEFSESRLLDNYRSFQSSLPEAQIFYSVKCNASAHVLKVLHHAGCGFEISSKLEFESLQKLGVPASKIICGLPVKPLEWIEYLATGGVGYFVFDDMREYIKLQSVEPEAKKILRIHVWDIAEHCIEYGMKVEEIQRNIEQLQDIDGVSFHISDNTNIELLLQTLDRAEAILQQLPVSAVPRILNIGGSYDLRQELNSFYDQLNQRLQHLINRYNLTIYAEPGAAIVNTAGCLVSRVVMIKERGGLTDVYIDAGIPIGATRPPGYLKVINHDRSLPKRRYYRFLDITSLHRPLFQSKLPFLIEEDDLLELGEYGAYTLCYRNDFHCWDRPEEILCR